MACAPQLVKGLRPVFARSAVKVAPGWRQQWSAILIDFINEVEGGKVTLQKPDEALRLAKELVWELIGGEQVKTRDGK
jgi:hypothetical protein